MADVSEIMKLDERKLKEVQAAVLLLHLLGLSDDDISLLPQIVKSWPTVVKNMNAMAEDLAKLRQALSEGKPDGKASQADSAGELQKMIGFGSATELVTFGADGGDRK